MRLILSRHGDTFGPGDAPVWIGRRTDLPLVATGEAQARRLGRALDAAGIALDGVYCGPLRRTRRHAEIAIEEADRRVAPVVDARLTEIDYGAWEGLTNREIAAGPFSAALEAWERRSLWPEAAEWAPSEESMATGIEDFVRGLAATHRPEASVLTVTSNGVLRYFLRLAPDAFKERTTDGTAKVATGNVCILHIERAGVSAPVWNAAPETLLSCR